MCSDPNSRPRLPNPKTRSPWKLHQPRCFRLRRGLSLRISRPCSIYRPVLARCRLIDLGSGSGQDAMPLSLGSLSVSKLSSSSNLAQSPPIILLQLYLTVPDLLALVTRHVDGVSLSTVSQECSPALHVCPSNLVLLSRVQALLLPNPDRCLIVLAWTTPICYPRHYQLERGRSYIDLISIMGFQASSLETGALDHLIRFLSHQDSPSWVNSFRMRSTYLLLSMSR